MKILITLTFLLTFFTWSQEATIYDCFEDELKPADVDLFISHWDNEVPGFQQMVLNLSLEKDEHCEFLWELYEVYNNEELVEEEPELYQEILSKVEQRVKISNLVVSLRAEEDEHKRTEIEELLKVEIAAMMDAEALRNKDEVKELELELKKIKKRLDTYEKYRARLIDAEVLKLLME